MGVVARKRRYIAHGCVLSPRVVEEEKVTSLESGGSRYTARYLESEAERGVQEMYNKKTEAAKECGGNAG